MWIKQSVSGIFLFRLLLLAVVERPDRQWLVFAGDTDFNKTFHQLEVRLTGGRYPNEGILELRWPPAQPEWGTYCTDIEEPFKVAHVACLALGYQAAYSVRATAPFALNTGPIWFRGIHCGKEVLQDHGRLEDCTLQPWHLGNASCDHSWDVGLVCYTGDVRLADGNSTNEGRIELHIGGDQWLSLYGASSSSDTQMSDVTCRYLGYPFAVGSSSEQVDRESVLCVHGFCWGSEGSPVDCQYDSKAVPCANLDFIENPTSIRALCALESDVVPNEDVLEFRLVGSADNHSGLVQVRDTTLADDGWRTLCNENHFVFIFDEPVARLGDLICKQLGFPWSYDTESVALADVRVLYRADWNDTRGAELLRRRVIKEDADRSRPETEDLFSWKWVRTENVCEQHGYPGLRVTCATGVELYGERVYPCPQQTCNQRCGTTEVAGLCGCDSACTLCNDCCPDYTSLCAPDGALPYPPNFPLACRVSSANQREYIIQRCGWDWADDDVRNRCEGDSPVDLVSHVPDESSYPPLFFRNRECAQCNYINTTSANMVDYETYKNTTVPPYWTLIGACPSGYNGSTKLREGCAGYSASLIINGSWYKNPHCALCNGEDLTSLDYCYRGYGIVAPASLEIILGRDSDAWFPSPSLEIHLGDSVRCLRKEYHLNIVPKPSQSNLAIDPKESPPMTAYEAASCLIRGMAWQSVPLTLPFISQLLAVDAEEFPTGDGTLLSTSLGNFSDTKALLHGLLTVEERSDESVQDTWVDKCNLEVVELAEVCTIANVTNVRTCHHQWFSTKDTEVVSNISISNVSVLYFGNGVIVEPYYLSHVHVYRNTDTGRFFNETEVRVCGRELEQLTCRFPPVNDTLVIVRDGTVYLSYAGREFLEGEFVSLPDGLVLICSDVFKEDGPYINLSEPLTLVNFLGFIISMAALVATFATYVTFSELRNVPGAAIMSLCAALFVAQLLSVTALGSTLNSSVCVTIAVVLHYLWLSTFTWQTVLAWDLKKTFASNRPSLGASKMKRFFLYSVYGWGAPVLVVGVFFAFHLCGDCMGLGYRYGSDKACWIIGRFAVLLAFGVPMMSSVILNGVLFASTVWGVHKTLKAASMVHQDRSKSQKASTELVIYLKISCVMGFTWIFGCLAQVTSYRPLWFLFVITNSAQGVIIFVVYACNARVRAMWRQRLRRTEAKKSDSAARATKASTPVTKGHSGNKSAGCDVNSV